MHEHVIEVDHHIDTEDYLQTFVQPKFLPTQSPLIMSEIWL